MKKTGDEYFDSDEFRELLAEYEEAVNTGQPVFMDADELAEIADYYQLTECYDKADDAIEMALSLSPGAIAPLTYKIHEALWNGNTQEARKYLDEIVETDEPDYVYDTAEILLAEERAEEADSYLRKELMNVPPDEYQDYVVDVANIFADYNQPEKAMQWMTRARQEDTPAFKELMARTLFGLGKYTDSEKLWGELIDTDPFSKRYWNALASTQLMAENYSAAIESSEYAIAIDPDDPDGLMAKANGLFRLGNYDDALDYFKRYSKQVPTDELGLLNQGTCLINTGQSEQAVHVLLDAIAVAPTDSPYLADIYQELAFAYNENGDTDQALLMLEKADQHLADPVQTLVVRGHIMLTEGRMEEAERSFRKAVTLSDTPHQTLLRVIVAIYDAHYLDAAYRLFMRYFKICPPDTAEGHAYMALCCYDMKRYDEFLSHLQTACQRNPHECQVALGHLFPQDLPPEQYYDYIVSKMKDDENFKL